MKRIFLLVVALLSFVVVQAQEHSIIIDESSFVPESGLAIDKIGKDTSKRPCARIKMYINRMTSAEIDQIKVMPVGGNVVVMKQVLSIEGNGLIIELTAKEQTRFYLHHDKFGDSNEVSLNLEGDKEYRISAVLNISYPIVISSNVRGAEVYIDNEYKGRTGDSYTLTVNDILPGTHQLKVQNGASIVEQHIEVSSENIYFRVDIDNVTSSPQYVVFEVKPKDAIVVIDNKSYIPDTDGVVMTTLNNGSYNYQISANSYHEERGTFVVSGNKVNKSVELRPAHGWITIESTAKLQNASVFIDNALVGKVPIKSYKLSSGEHKIKIIRNLYQPFEGTIIIKDNETLKFSPTLATNFATVTLTVANGADIYVNNVYKGSSSWTGDLEAGTYIFEARKSDHRSTSISRNITTQQQRQSITLDAPTPINGSLNLTCSPAIANVAIDGVSFGETPLMTPLLIGKHNITVSKKGYKDYSTNVTIKEGATENITVKLQEDIEPGYIDITSSQYNANVYVDGTYIGTTPISYTAERGTYTVKVSKSGYSTESQKVTVTGGRRSNVYASLTPSLGNKAKRAVNNTVDGIADTVDDVIDAIGDTVEDVVYTITDLDGFNIGPTIGFGFDVSNLDLSYPSYYDGYYGGGYYDYYYSAKNSQTRSSSSDSSDSDDVGAEFSIGLTWRLWSYDTLFNVTTGLHYIRNKGRNIFSIPAVPNINLYMYDFDCSMYFGVGTEFNFVYDDNYYSYYKADSSYQGMQLPVIIQYGVADRHNDLCFYLKLMPEESQYEFGAFMGLKYTYFF